MNNIYILKLLYDNNEINDKLLPWHNESFIQTPKNKKSPKCNFENTVTCEQYQIGIAIKCPINGVQIITPFFIHIPYSVCGIWNNGDNNIKLKLYNYCYFTRLASFIIDFDNSYDNSNLNISLFYN